MPNRDFDTGTWNDPWFEQLDLINKFLFIYTWTNNHCTQSGMYYITFKKISDETGIPISKLPERMKQLYPKVLYDENQYLLWVRNFVRKQRKSDTFLVAVSRCLEKIRPHPFLKEFLKEYQGFKIAYLQTIDNMVIDDISVSLSVSLSNSLSLKEGGVGETKTSLPEWIDESVWKEFLKMREKIRKPATEEAKRLILKDLTKWQAEGHDPNEILRESIRKSWQDVYKPKGDHGSDKGKPNKFTGLDDKDYGAGAF